MQLTPFQKQYDNTASETVKDSIKLMSPNGLQNVRVTCKQRSPLSFATEFQSLTHGHLVITVSCHQVAICQWSSIGSWWWWQLLVVGCLQHSGGHLEKSTLVKWYWVGMSNTIRWNFHMLSSVQYSFPLSWFYHQYENHSIISTSLDNWGITGPVGSKCLPYFFNPSLYIVPTEASYFV